MWLTSSHSRGSISLTTGRSFGLIVVSDQAIAAGVASLPASDANSDAPFFVWEPLAVRIRLATAVGFDGNAGYHQIVDSKAMRKVGNNEDLVSVVSLVGAPGGFLSLEGRILIKLH